MFCFVIFCVSIISFIICFFTAIKPHNEEHSYLEEPILDNILNLLPQPGAPEDE